MSGQPHEVMRHPSLSRRNWRLVAGLALAALSVALLGPGRGSQSDEAVTQTAHELISMEPDRKPREKSAARMTEPAQQVVPGSASFSPNPSAADDDTVVVLLQTLLPDYLSAETSHEDKLAIENTFAQLASSKTGQSAIARLFFSEQFSEAIYELMLDADLKDHRLLRELIQNQRFGSSTDITWRLIDLVADLSGSGQPPFEQTIADFLAHASMDSDSRLSSFALSQWAWYVIEDQGVMPVLNAYLFHPSPAVRGELYEMITLERLTDPQDRAEAALVLDSLRHAQYLGIDEAERQTIRELIDRLKVSQL